MVDTVSDYYNDITLRYSRLSRQNPLTLDGTGMTDEQFHVFCMDNPELRIERNVQGKIIIMPPTNSETGHYNSEINAELVFWNRKHKLGITFDSSTGFKLPNGADRSPDSAWIANERWNALPAGQKKRFASIAPDFVLELRSDDQSLTELREKMDEYMDCGCRLGWMVDPQNRRTYVYTANGDIQTVKFDEVLSGGDVMPGLEVYLGKILGV